MDKGILLMNDCPGISEARETGYVSFDGVSSEIFELCPLPFFSLYYIVLWSFYS